MLFSVVALNRALAGNRLTRGANSLQWQQATHYHTTTLPMSHLQNKKKKKVHNLFNWCACDLISTSPGNTGSRALVDISQSNREHMLNREHRGDKCCELIVRRVKKKKNLRSPLLLFLTWWICLGSFSLLFSTHQSSAFPSLSRCLLAPSAPSFITFSEITSTTLNVSWGFPVSPNGVVEGYRVVYEPTAPIQGTRLLCYSVRFFLFLSII